EHEDMHGKRDTVLTAFSNYINFEGSPNQYGSEAVVTAGSILEAAMVDYDAYVCLHLFEEEEFVIPMILELSQQEFTDLNELELTVLFRKLDQQDKANGIKSRGKKR
ncbi:UNVERIFIED_CONTAM: hypothetical protein HDU68_008646, partial [Siphonaria sp. JEL0065]